MDTTSSTTLDSAIGDFLREKIPSQFLTQAEEFAARFCQNGQIAVATLLVFAEEDGKTGEALQALETTWQEHWKYQHPDARGDPDLSSANRQRLNAVYQELGIALPWDRE